MDNNLIKKGNTFFGLSTAGKAFFFFQVIGVFALSFVALYIIGFAPKELKGPSTDISGDILINDDLDGRETDDFDQEDRVVTKTKPERIIIEKIGVDSGIEHPTTQAVSILDQFLTRGVVHYPGSGILEEGNIFLFGHSADRFQYVSNPALKVFNGIYKLEKGDEVILTANNKRYIYSIDSVDLVDANTAFVDFSKTGQKLTISTCNTFGEQQERWIVEATLKTIKS